MINANCEQENIIVNSLSLDDYFYDKNKKPTYIKLDVEGAEMKALKGAEGIISEFKPKLAVSIYHNLEDIWEIPLYLVDKYPFYNYYIRHHDVSTFETILYAVTS